MKQRRGGEQGAAAHTGSTRFHNKRVWDRTTTAERHFKKTRRCFPLKLLRALWPQAVRRRRNEEELQRHAAHLCDRGRRLLSLLNVKTLNRPGKVTQSSRLVSTASFPGVTLMGAASWCVNCHHGRSGGKRNPTIVLVRLLCKIKKKEVVFFFSSC